jgi:hypothetical protein
LSSLLRVGKEYYEARESIMLKRRIGLTGVYNLFHDHSENDQEIQSLRELHISVDLAVADSYGWTDVKFDHDFYELKQGIRFSISEESRVIVFRRLLKLNSQLHQEEVNKGHEKAASRTRVQAARKINKSPDKPTLFDFNSSHTKEVSRYDQAVLSWLFENDDWFAKADILSGSDIPANQWQSTINQLLADGLVERQGERRGTRYRAARMGDRDE